MASSHVVYSDLPEDAPAQGTLFEGLRIWVAMRVPMRKTFVSQIRDNGGQVVPLEKDADMMIADHMRSEAPSGSFSWKWIEACIKEGRLVDKEEYRAASKEVVTRPVGALKPVKTSRVPYTDADDLELYNWVKAYERRGGKVLGNEIYKQLEEQNNRHPWQSWRDRYVKYISLRPPPRAALIAASTPPPPAQSAQSQVAATQNLEPPSSPLQPTPASLTTAEGKKSTATEARSSENQGPAKQAQTKEPAHHKSSLKRKVSPGRENSPTERMARPTHQRADSNGSLASSVAALRQNDLRRVSASASPSRSTTPVQGQRSRSSLRNSELAAQPEFSNFNQTEYDFLYDQAHRIQNSTVEGYPELWEQMTIFQPAHSAEEWQEYYELVVLPAWKAKDAYRFRVTASQSADNSPKDLPYKTPDKRQSRRKPDGVDGVADAQRASPTPVTRSNPVVVINSAAKTGKQPAAPDAGDRSPSASQTSKRKGLEAMRKSPRKRQRIESDASGSQSPQSTTAAEDVHAKERRQYVDLVDASAGDRKGPIQVYESQAVPEGEKENYLMSESGSPKMPQKHVHVKNHDALEVFTNPPSDFMLHDGKSDRREESWHDVDELDPVNGKTGNDAAVDDAMEVGQAVANEAEAEAAHRTTAENAAAGNEDPEILDELRHEYEFWQHNGDVEVEEEQQKPSQIPEPDTQAILNAATQVPDFYVPPPDEGEEEEKEEEEEEREPDGMEGPRGAQIKRGEVNYPQLPQMSQDDQGDNEGEEDEEDADDDYEEPDLETPPPPSFPASTPRRTAATKVLTMTKSMDDEYDDIDTFESQFSSQHVKRVHSSLLTQPPRQRMTPNHRRPRASPPPVSSPTPARMSDQAHGRPLPGTNHPTISGLTVRKGVRDQYNNTDPNRSASPSRSHYSHQSHHSHHSGRSHPSSKSESTAAWVAQTSPILPKASPYHPVKPNYIDPKLIPPRPTPWRSSAAPTSKQPNPFSSSTSRQASSNLRNSLPSTSRPNASASNRRSSLPSSSRPYQQQNPRSSVPLFSHIHPPITSLNAYKTYHLALGSSPHSILISARHTNLDYGLASFVLENLESTGQVPRGVKGVWTGEDDEVLRGSDPGAMRGLERVHGREGVRRRRELLRGWGAL